MSPRMSRGAVRPRHAVLVCAVLLLQLLCLHATSVAAVTATVWMNTPAGIWSGILSGSGASGVELATKQDVTTAVQGADGSATVTSVSLQAYTSSTTTGPVYGALLTMDVSTTLSAADVVAAVRASSFSYLNSAIGSATSESLAIKAMSADSPDVMTAVMSTLLPVTGSTFLWSEILGSVENASEIVSGFFYLSLQNDLQSAVDSTGTSFLATTTSDYVTNASSCYLPYQVWAYPGVPISTSVAHLRSRAAVVTASTSTTASDLTALVMASTLPLFNARVSSLQTTFPDLSNYADWIPTSVRPWTPLPGDPFDGSSSSTNPALTVYGTIVGTYLLNFAGDADTWARVWESKKSSVTSTIESAITTELHRRTFQNTAKVLGAQVVPSGSYQITGLQVTCQVVQGVTPSSQHSWSPEQLAAMLKLTSYNATQALYTSSAGAAGVLAPTTATRGAAAAVWALAVDSSAADGSLVSAGVYYDYSSKMSIETIGIIAMACIIVGLSLLALIVAVSCCCCCPSCLDDSVERKLKSQRLRDEASAYGNAENSTRDDTSSSVSTAADSVNHSGRQGKRGVREEEAEAVATRAAAQGRVVHRDSAYTSGAYMSTERTNGASAAAAADGGYGLGIKAPPPPVPSATAHGVPMEMGERAGAVPAALSGPPPADSDTETISVGTGKGTRNTGRNPLARSPKQSQGMNAATMQDTKRTGLTSAAPPSPQGSIQNRLSQQSSARASAESGKFPQVDLPPPAYKLSELRRTSPRPL